MSKSSFLSGILFSCLCIFLFTLIEHQYLNTSFVYNNRNLRLLSELKSDNSQKSPRTLTSNFDSQKDILLQSDIVKDSHQSDWSLPSRIVEERNKECEVGRTSKTGGFCISEKRRNIGGNEIVDMSLADYLENNVFAGKTVVDLGAGLGHYGKFFKEEGSKVAGWVGYDGALNVHKVTNGLVKFMDLTQPDAGDERDCASADWVLSLEVGEHIPAEYTNSYLRNIRCHASEGAVISWAQQGGHMHVNMQPVENVMRMMEEWGFKVDHERTKELREAAKRYYFKRNAVVYVL